MAGRTPARDRREDRLLDLIERRRDAVARRAALGRQAGELHLVGIDDRGIRTGERRADDLLPLPPRGAAFLEAHRQIHAHRHVRRADVLLARRHR